MRVTIVTPSLNGARYIRECIQSTKAQESAGIEVEHVVVDGGSTDGTVEIAQSLGGVVVTGKDDGIFDAINKGYKHSSGKLFGFLGCDDVMLPGAFETAAQAYRRTGRRWIVGGVRWTDEHGRSRGDCSAPPTWMSVPMSASLGWNCIMQMSTFFEREFFFELGGFDKQMKYSGDYEFFLRALQREPFARVDRTLACFRRHGGNQSMSANPARKAEEQRVMDTYGPPQAWRRAAYRGLLKVWLNGKNPSWFACKRIDHLFPRPAVPSR